MSEQNKIEQIKSEYQMAEELFKRQPQMRDKFNQTHDWIGYLLAEIERKDEALNEIELILTDDRSTQAIEINQVINRAREAL